MNILNGYAEARRTLSRRLAGVTFETSPQMKQRAKDNFGEPLSAEAVVQRIVEDVKRRGDKAVIDYCERLDGVVLKSIEATNEEIQQALASTPADLISALKYAALRIRSFHRLKRGAVGTRVGPGGVGTVVRPLDRVGVYVPGGRAWYPSTVLMTVIPAKAAGVREVILCTPAGRDGSIPAPTLAAAAIAGADRVYKVGGAQAVAAMAYGTESVPPVDKICGPGNIFVTLAKRAVFGNVDIDGLQGPSEMVVIADRTANPAQVAADLLAQGEHDPLARAVLIALSKEVADCVQKEIQAQVAASSRKNILVDSLLESGIIAIVESRDEALSLTNAYAPEHVSLQVEDPELYLAGIRNAGCVFVGTDCAPALGDYVAGPSHVLPTAGTARFSSPLGVQDFLKSTSIVRMRASDRPKLSGTACTIARSEGLEAHCESVLMRVRGRHGQA